MYVTFYYAFDVDVLICIYNPLDPTCILCPPSRSFTPATGLCNRIIGALATRLHRRPAQISRHLPEQLKLWGKIRILPAGDTIHASEVCGPRGDRRDQTFVRVRLLIAFIFDVSLILVAFITVRNLGR